MFDFIPGDNKKRILNLEIINNFIFNSVLWQYIHKDLKDNSLKRIGIAYGDDITPNNRIKNFHEYVITDWIARSCFNYYSNNPANAKEKKVGELAVFLKKEGLLKIINSPKIRFD